MDIIRNSSGNISRIKLRKYLITPTYTLHKSLTNDYLAERLPRKFKRESSVLVRINRYLSENTCILKFRLDLEMFLADFDSFIKISDFIYSIKDYINIGIFQLHKGLIAIQFEGIGVMGFMRADEIKAYIIMFKNYIESLGYSTT